MSIYNRETDTIEETDDSHDYEWWAMKENRILLEAVAIAFEQYSTIQYGGRKWTFASWRNHIVNAPSVRESFRLSSIPSSRLWPRLRKLLK